MDTLECTTPTSLCVTPTMVLNGEQKFKFTPETPKMALSVDRVKTNINLSGRRRSFTPMKNGILFESPDLSPIACNNGKYSIVRLPPEKVSKAQADSTVIETPPITQRRNFLVPLSPAKYMQLSTSAGKKRYQSSDCDATLIPGRNYVFNSGENRRRHASIPEELAKKSPGVLDKSARHGYLNHKLSVETILVGNHLSKYVPVFEQEEIDFEIFLTLTDNDLIRLGVDRVCERNILLEIIRDI